LGEPSLGSGSTCSWLGALWRGARSRGRLLGLALSLEEHPTFQEFLAWGGSARLSSPTRHSQLPQRLLTGRTGASGFRRSSRRNLHAQVFFCSFSAVHGLAPRPHSPGGPTRGLAQSHG